MSMTMPILTLAEYINDDFVTQEVKLIDKHDNGYALTRTSHIASIVLWHHKGDGDDVQLAKYKISIIGANTSGDYSVCITERYDAYVAAKATYDKLISKLQLPGFKDIAIVDNKEINASYQSGLETTLNIYTDVNKLDFISIIKNAQQPFNPERLINRALIFHPHSHWFDADSSMSIESAISNILDELPDLDDFIKFSIPLTICGSNQTEILFRLSKLNYIYANDNAIEIWFDDHVTRLPVTPKYNDDVREIFKTIREQLDIIDAGKSQFEVIPTLGYIINNDKIITEEAFEKHLHLGLKCGRVISIKYQGNVLPPK